MEKNLPSNRKLFGMKTEDFRKRQQDALQKRLQGALTAKQIAYAIGVHGDTFLNWANGYTIMNGPAIEAVNGFFESIGDWNFIADIYGEIGVRRRQRAEQLETQAKRLREQAVWLSAEGMVA